MVEGSIVPPGAGPSGKSYGLYNPADGVIPNNADIVPTGTGPSNESSGGTPDPYWVVIAS